MMAGLANDGLDQRCEDRDELLLLLLLLSVPCNLFITNVAARPTLSSQQQRCIVIGVVFILFLLLLLA